MPYKINDPTTVLSPRKNVKNVTVLYNGGNIPGAYSIAKLKWNGDDVIGIRWNISENEISNKSNGIDLCLGEPNSRGYSTWFVLPDDMINKLITDDNLKTELSKYLESK